MCEKESPGWGPLSVSTQGLELVVGNESFSERSAVVVKRELDLQQSDANLLKHCVSFQGIVVTIALVECARLIKVFETDVFRIAN